MVESNYLREDREWRIVDNHIVVGVYLILVVTAWLERSQDVLAR